MCNDDSRAAEATAAAPVSRGISRRKLLLGGGVLAVCTLVGARIGYVNAAGVPMAEVIHHPVGEWAALEGAFQRSKFENTAGYSLRVNAARLVSYNEFVLAYANDGSEPIEGYDAPAVVDLDVTIKNDSDKDGGEAYLHLFSMTLVPARKNTAYIVDDTLFAASQKSIREGGGGSLTISVKARTEYELHFPYVRNDSSQAVLDGREVETRYVEPMADRRFEWNLSTLPVHHVVDIEL